MESSSDSPSRRRNRPKRLSTLRLSTDTTASLPAYSAPPVSRSTHWPDPPLDEPPDYPQSAEEADKEDDFVPLPPPTRIRKNRHRRSESLTLPAPTTSVDDLLERSVVALELSTNALLQSMNTQSTLSSIANDQMLERSLERQAMLLDMRLRGNRAAHEGWIDDLNDVMNRVDGLSLPRHPSDGSDGISRSLPTENPLQRRPRPHKQASTPTHPSFQLTTSSEVDLRDTIRAPRALTQYVSVESSLGDTTEVTADADSIFLPSTTGLRAPAKLSTFVPPGREVSSPCNKFSISPTDGIPTTSTSAYTFLSSLVSGQTTPSSASRLSETSNKSSTSSRSRGRRRHRTRGSRRHSAGSADTSLLPPTLRRTRSTSRSRSSTPASDTTIIIGRPPLPLPPPPPVRAMTPPMEESTPSSSSESDPSAYRTVQSLRKILDDDADAHGADLKGKGPASMTRPPSKPMFYPRTPAVAPSSGTSMATASVYRLFTKSSHHPAVLGRPKQSSLKKRGVVVLSGSEEGPPVASGSGQGNTHGVGSSGSSHLLPESQLSSAPSTPRQVSFAELPREFPGRESSWRREGRNRRRNSKDKGKGKEAASWSSLGSSFLNSPSRAPGWSGLGSSLLGGLNNGRIKRKFRSTGSHSADEAADGDETDGLKGWWKWFATPGMMAGPIPSGAGATTSTAAGGMGAAGSYEDRMEERMMRGWGKPGGAGSAGGMVDEWIF